MATYERLTPTDAQLSTLLKSEWAGPMVMVNLLQFRIRAAYPRDYKGPNPDVSGAEAYARYGEVAFHRIQALGGRILWSGEGYATVVGPVNERWDQVIAVEYPDKAAFSKLPEDADYVAATVHREAGLAETRVIACKGGTD